MTVSDQQGAPFDRLSFPEAEGGELEGFRLEVDNFLAVNLPRELRHKVLGGFHLSKDELLGWQAILHGKRWAAGSWPTEYGGSGWSVRQSYVFEEACAAYGAPTVSPMGIGMVGPLLISAGSQWQKDRFLKPMVEGGEFWCQGFSEPGSGSDLASLRCAAQPVDGGYIVNGSKIWTTHAQWADWCILLARTNKDGPRQSGISILLVDMKTPGVVVRPIISLDGAHVLNQVFFTDVFVPEIHRVGEENRGWTILKQNIGLERIANGAPGIAKSMRQRLILVAGRADARGKCVANEDWFRAKLAHIDVRLLAFEAAALRAIEHDDLLVRPEASLIKTRGTELQQDILRLAVQVGGYSSLAYDANALTDGWRDDSDEAQLAPIVPAYLFMRKASISSGTNEIQRDIIAQHILGRAE